jgi:prevent-host-death family protein
MAMRSVGLFEAKTKLSELCDRVDRRGEAVTITRRGRAIARLVPIAPGKGADSIWDRRRGFIERIGALQDDLPLPRRARQTIRDLFD